VHYCVSWRISFSVSSRSSVRSGNLIKGLLRNKHNAQSDISNAFCRWIKAHFQAIKQQQFEVAAKFIVISIRIASNICDSSDVSNTQRASCRRRRSSVLLRQLNCKVRWSVSLAVRKIFFTYMAFRKWPEKQFTLDCFSDSISFSNWPSRNDPHCHTLILISTNLWRPRNNLLFNLSPSNLICQSEASCERKTYANR